MIVNLAEPLPHNVLGHIESMVRSYPSDLGHHFSKVEDFEQVLEPRVLSGYLNDPKKRVREVVVEVIDLFGGVPGIVVDNRQGDLLGVVEVDRVDVGDIELEVGKLHVVAVEKSLLLEVGAVLEYVYLLVRSFKELKGVFDLVLVGKDLVHHRDELGLVEHNILALGVKEVVL